MRLHAADRSTEGEIGERLQQVLGAHWSAFVLAVAQSHPQWVDAPSPVRVDLEAGLLEPWARQLLDIGAVEALTRGDPMRYPTTMFTHGQELLHPYHVRSPGMLLAPFGTVPQGPGIAELAEDGLRFIGSTLHYWAWDVLKSWSEEHGYMLMINTTPEGGGYSVMVQPGNATHRWIYLLPSHGVVQVPTRGEPPPVEE
jgi:hypothetical protein